MEVEEKGRVATTCMAPRTCTVACSLVLSDLLWLSSGIGDRVPSLRVCLIAAVFIELIDIVVKAEDF